MSSDVDTCARLRKLHKSLTSEISELKRDVRLEEAEGVANPLEFINVIKSLQNTLNTVEQELEKCPAEM